MLTKNTAKYVKSLHAKKFREIHARFIAEGPKIVRDIANSKLIIDQLFATGPWMEANTDLISKIAEAHRVTEKELAGISLLTTPNQVLATVVIPESKFSAYIADRSLVITLDNIRDPGNLGTIIRIADWFGYRYILCSDSSVDAFNPKCVQATMGSLARVSIYYGDLEQILPQSAGNTPIYGAFLSGNNIFEVPLEPHGFLIIGNEANGITQKIEALVKKRLFIPSGIGSGPHAESLNASAAAAIICAEFFRRSADTTNLNV
ncbi:MAG TPA: RNA methyltransferase [Bacteroidales bacterium]|nr:RNA methyltransferase [Bacteroidales bacterium]